MQANCRANRLGIRHRHRQRRRPADSRNALPSGGRIGRSVRAFLYRKRERLAVVVGLISMRVCHMANLWGLMVMDQLTRRMVGFAVPRGVVDGLSLGRMFHRAIHAQTLPKSLSSDPDPLYRFHPW